MKRKTNCAEYRRLAHFAKNTHRELIKSTSVLCRCLEHAQEALYIACGAYSNTANLNNRYFKQIATIMERFEGFSFKDLT